MQGEAVLTERLTDRAKSVLDRLPKTERVPVVVLIEEIIAAGGMGSAMLQEVKTLSIPPQHSVEINRLIKEAFYQALSFEHSYVGTEHLLLAVFKITKQKDMYEQLRLECMKLNIFSNTLRSFNINKNTPIINTFTRDVTREAARQLDNGDLTLLERKEYLNTVSALLKEHNSNVLLIGDPGVGKDSIIKLLAQNMVLLNVPPSLMGYRLLEVDLLAFMMGFINRGGIELGLYSFVDELRMLGRVILSIENLSNVFFASTGTFAVPMFYTLFKAMLRQADIRFVATMSNQMYERVSSDNEHIFEDITVIDVEEPTKKDALLIMKREAAKLERHHKLKIPVDVTNYIYDYAVEENLLSDAKFPKRGVDLMDIVCSFTIMKKSKIPVTYRRSVDKTLLLADSIDAMLSAGKYEKAADLKVLLSETEDALSKQEVKFLKTEQFVVSKEDVDDAVDALVKGDLGISAKYRLSRVANLSDRIKSQLIGQDAAVDTVSKAMIRASLGLKTGNRPLSSYLFLGPTGVGKTELAKLLSTEFFGENALIRLDMSDFSEKHMVARLIGAPPGYVGFGEGGELTTKIAAKPDSVVLFDEIEKAHPDVLNILLQIMEEGELLDARGHMYDFSRSVIILTSNLGTEIFHKSDIGFYIDSDSGAEPKDRLEQNLKKIMKPELINRFDEIIYFQQLKQEAQFRIIDLLIGKIKDNMKPQNISLSVAKSAKELLLKKGYSKEYGARALRRTVEKELLDKIAEVLLKNKKRPIKLNALAIKDHIKIQVINS